jgi:hypothetical protein
LTRLPCESPNEYRAAGGGCQAARAEKNECYSVSAFITSSAMKRWPLRNGWTGSGQKKNLWGISTEISRRLTRIFLRGKERRRPVYGGSDMLQTDPHWRDLILFYEYFHGDTGAGLGASHQTGWTGLVAKLLQQSGG